MKKLLVIIAVIIMVLTTSGIAFANDDCPHYGPYASDEGNGPGPAPNSGDGIPDGPGWE